MGIISLNEKRTGTNPTHTTGKEKSYFTSDQFAEAPAFQGVTDGLKLWIDYGNTDCWAGTSGTGVDDYTVKNLVSGGPDGYIRKLQSGTTFAHDSSAPTMYKGESDDGSNGYLECDPSDYSDSDDKSAVILAGSFTSTTATSVVHNMPTVASTSTDNLMYGVGTGQYTIELWARMYSGSSDSGYSRLLAWHLYDAGDENNALIQLLYWGSGQTSYSNKIRFQFYRYGGDGSIEMDHFNAAGAPSSGWSAWNHIVISRNDTTSNDTRIYINNSLVGYMTDVFDISYFRWGYMPGVISNAGQSIKSRHAIFRFYNGNALSASEVTQHWNLEKARFGH